MKTKLKLTVLAMALASPVTSANELCKEVSFTELKTYSEGELTELYVDYAKTALFALQQDLSPKNYDRRELFQALDLMLYRRKEVELCIAEQKRITRLIKPTNIKTKDTLTKYSIELGGNDASKD